MNKAELSILDSTLENAILLQRFTAGEKAKVLKILTDLQAELRLKMMSSLTDFSKARVNKLLSESTAIIEAAYKDMVPVAKSAGPITAEEFLKASGIRIEVTKQIKNIQFKLTEDVLGMKIIVPAGYNLKTAENQKHLWHEIGHYIDNAQSNVKGATNIFASKTWGEYSTANKEILKKFEEYILKGKEPPLLTMDLIYQSGKKKITYKSLEAVMADDSLSAATKAAFRKTVESRQAALAKYMSQDIELFADGFKKYIIEKGLMEVTAPELAKVFKDVFETNPKLAGVFNSIENAPATNFLGLAAHEATATVQSFVAIGLEAALPSAAVLKALVNGSLIEGAPSAAWWAKQGADLAFKFASQVRQGITAGETVMDIMRRVAGSPKLGIPGIMDVSRRNAFALVHTSIMQVANDARMAVYKENDDIIKGWRHLSTLDSHTCVQQCVPRSGAEWDMDGKPTKGNLPFKKPPLHFACRCLLLPILKSYRALGVDIDEPPTGTRSSDLGQIPADTSFDAFLQRHDKKYQDTLLGPGRADLWRDGKISLSSLVGQNNRPLTLEQLRGISKAAIPSAESIFNLRKITDVSPEFASKVKSTLDKIPDHIHQAVADAGYTVQIGDRLTNIRPDLKGVHPRGWPAGSTWDSAEGVHYGSSSQVIIAETHRPIRAKEFTTSKRVAGVTMHEYGHAADIALGNISSNKEFQAAYRTDTKAIKSDSRTQEELKYFLQKRGAGQLETFAEGFSQIFDGGAGRSDFNEKFPAVMKYLQGLREAKK